MKILSFDYSRLVSEFSKRTGDYHSLSSIDLKLIALTYQLECEHGPQKGADIKTEPSSGEVRNGLHNCTYDEKETDNNGNGNLDNLKTSDDDKCNSDGKVTGIDCNLDNLKTSDDGEYDDGKKAGTDNGNLDNQETSDDGKKAGTDDGNLDNQETIDDAEYDNDGKVVRTDDGNLDNQETSDDGEYDNDGKVVGTDDGNPENQDDEGKVMGTDDSNLDNQQYDNEEDEGWITPNNIKKVTKMMGGGLEEEISHVAVGCITTDYAIQVRDSCVMEQNVQYRY